MEFPTKKYDVIYAEPGTFISGMPKINFEWEMADSTRWNLVVKKTWYNRWKWWIATKLFLPGTYRWLS
jgi:hypothetical protein